MNEERQRNFSEKHLERIKRKNLNIELSETWTKMQSFRKIDVSFGKVN